MTKAPTIKSLVLGYAEIVRGAVDAAAAAGDVRGWERYANWEQLMGQMQPHAQAAMLALEQPAAKKARTAVARTVRKAEDPDVTVTGDDGLFFGEANPYSVSWAQTRSSDFITNLSDSMRAAVRDYVAQATQEGLPPASLAKQLQGVVGLRPDQADALEAMRAQFEADGRARSEIDNLIAARGKRMLSQRATMIARTELNAAQNAGAMNEWAQAAADGDLPTDAKREWMDADGCKVCVELVAQGTKGLGEPWHSTILGKDIMAPPAHPSCRCTQALVL